MTATNAEILFTGMTPFLDDSEQLSVVRFGEMRKDQLLPSIRSGVLVLAAMILFVATLTGCRSSGESSTHESLDGFAPPVFPQWAKDEGFTGNPNAVSGAKIFAQVGCLQCHTYLGTGSSNLGAPDLSAIGKDSSRSVAGFAAYVADPSKFGDDVMPHFKALGRAHLLELGAFLDASGGRR